MKSSFTLDPDEDPGGVIAKMIVEHTKDGEVVPPSLLLEAAQKKAEDRAAAVAETKKALADHPVTKKIEKTNELQTIPDTWKKTSCGYSQGSGHHAPEVGWVRR